MKKILLGTSALVGAAMLAGPAAAQFTVTVGGYSEVQFGWFDLDRAPGVTNDRNTEFRNDTEVQVRATAKSDNGLTYGVFVEMDTGAASAVSFDETRLFIRGTFGEVQFGDDDGASDVLAVYAPTVGIGQFDGAQGDFGSAASVPPKPNDSSDSTKATYLTPVFSGFQAGISYAATENQGDSVLTVNATGSESDFIEIGANYRGTFSGVGILVGAGWTTWQIERVAGATTADDGSELQAGLQISYAGFTVGGGYLWGESDVNVNGGLDNAWNIGATYASGPFAVGISYGVADRDVAGTTQQREDSILGIGGQYTLAPGLLLRADYYVTERDNTGAVQDLEDNILVLGVRVNF
jgi:outer membrane protein OmpU